MSITYNTFDYIVNGYELNLETEQGEHAQLINIVNSVVWNEIEAREQSIAFGRHVLDHNGIGVYYDYGADYYFFTDLEWQYDDLRSM